MAALGRAIPSAVPAEVRCAVYTRKSTSAGLEQDFNSLDAQREACENYVKSQTHQRWTLLLDRYDDGGFTGANLERPAFQRLLADIEAGRVNLVVVYKVDRLSRSLLDFARVMERFSKAGVAFVSVTQNFSTADAIGRLTLNMLMSFAEFEREMIGERTRDKIAASRRRGKWTGGSVPLGYHVVDRKLVVDDLEAGVVREMFEGYLAHRSLLAVVRTLDARGRIARGCRLPGGRKGSGWRKDIVLRALRNPLYAGLIRTHEGMVKGEHQGLVDRDHWEAVQALLDRDTKKARGRVTGEARNPDYLLRGLLVCGCGHALTPASTRTRGKDYRYYRCVRRDKEGAASCATKPLPAEAIENFVLDRIRAAVTDADLAGEVLRRIEARVATERTTLAAEVNELPGKAAIQAERAKRLVDGFEKVAPEARHSIQERIGEVNAGRLALENRLQEARRELAALDQEVADATWGAEVLADFEAVWTWMTPDNRARLFGLLVARVVVDSTAGTMRLELRALAGAT